MSAFNCSPKHFQYIANVVAFMLHHNEYRYKFVYSFGLEHETINNLKDTHQYELLANKLVTELQQLNSMAVAGRYKETPKPVTKINSNRIEGTISFNMLKMIKALNCTLYQCSEEPVYGSKKFNQWQHFTHSLEHSYISELAEYDNQDWGIE